MKLSHRSKLSLVQFLALFSRDALSLLLSKYGLSIDELEYASVAEAVSESVLAATDPQIRALLDEAGRTKSSMRSQVSPKYRFDERWQDLLLCLELDGYVEETDDYGRETGRLLHIEPVIEGAETPEDDLARELRRSGLPETEAILGLLDKSASAFRSGDFNGCLNNARVVVQTLAASIAQARLSSHSGNFDATKWGQVASYLRSSGLITDQQEKGLAGVFGFVSPGSHTPLGFTDQEFARLGRSLVVSMCYFLVKQFNAGTP
jgi:hypothetical protein